MIRAYRKQKFMIDKLIHNMDEVATTGSLIDVVSLLI